MVRGIKINEHPADASRTSVAIIFNPKELKITPSTQIRVHHGRYYLRNGVKIRDLNDASRRATVQLTLSSDPETVRFVQTDNGVKRIGRLSPFSEFGVFVSHVVVFLTSLFGMNGLESTQLPSARSENPKTIPSLSVKRLTNGQA